MDDGTRTRDSQNHNLELYHLSYIHRDPFRIPRRRAYLANSSAEECAGNRENVVDPPCAIRQLSLHKGSSASKKRSSRHLPRKDPPPLTFRFILKDNGNRCTSREYGT